jgi:hypothetical protein
VNKYLGIIVLVLIAGAIYADQIQPRQGVIKSSDSLASQETKQTQQDQREATRAIQDLVGLMRVEQQHDAENRQTQQNRDAYEDEIQRKLANYTLLLAIVGFLQFLVLAGTGYVVYLQRNLMGQHAAHLHDLAEAARNNLTSTKESVGVINRQAEIMTRQANEMEQQRGVMQGQLDTMRGQLELEHRPWVAVNVEPSSPIVFDERGCVLMCKITLTNVGHSVAKHVSLWTDFSLLGTENPTEVRNSLCDIMRRPENKGSDYGWLLFPGQSAIEQRPIIALPDRVKKALENKTFQGLNAIGLHLVGCVDYPSPIDSQKRHQTRFEYIVSAMDVDRGAVTGAFDPSKKMYQPVILTPTMHGASAE